MGGAHLGGLAEKGAIRAGEAGRRQLARGIGQADVEDGALGLRVGVVLSRVSAVAAEGRLGMDVVVHEDGHVAPRRAFLPESVAFRLSVVEVLFCRESAGHEKAER